MSQDRVLCLENTSKQYETDGNSTTGRCPAFSVIVPVRDSEKDIIDCLDSLMRLDYNPFEVIVVDDGSSDRTREVVARYPVRLLTVGGLGAYAARNRGIEAARNEIIAFTDSDCVVDYGWLKNLAECYENDQIAGVGGRIVSSRSNDLIGEFQGLGPQEIFDSPRRVELGGTNTNRFLVEGIGSGNMSFRSCALKQVKGFSEDMSKCADYEICWRIQKQGYRLVYEPKALVYHKPRSSVKGFVVQFYQLGKSQPQLLKKEREGYSYVELKTYLFATRGIRCKLPFQMLITIDFFSLATLSLFLFLYNPLFVSLLVVFGLGCLKQAWTKTEGIQDPGVRAKLLLAFPFLHALRSYSYSLGRFVGGVTNGVLSF